MAEIGDGISATPVPCGIFRLLPNDLLDKRRGVCFTCRTPTTFIYALCCPTTKAVRYIGKSDVPLTRLHEHAFRFRHPNSRKSKWLKALRDMGLMPTLKIVEEVPVAEWQSAERRYIRQAKEAGWDLVNDTWGGEGFDGGEANPLFGKKRPKEFCEKLRMAKLGKPRPPGLMEKLRLGNIGRVRSKESREKQSRATVGRKRPGWKSSSKFVGVSWEQRRHKWIARILVGGRTVNLGRYALEEDAARAYDKAARPLNRPTNESLQLLPPHK